MYRVGAGKFLAVAVGVGGLVLATADGGVADQGLATFEPAETYYIGNYPREVTLADLDEDGFDDALTPVTYGNFIAVSPADGAGGLLTAASYFTGSAPSPEFQGNHPVDVAVGDLNGDGALDFVAACASGTSAYLALGDGDGTFQTPVPLPVGVGQVDVALADLDMDGDHDLVFVTPGVRPAAGEVLVFLNDGEGAFGARSGVEVGATPGHVDVADLDHDNRVDLAVTNSGDENVSILRGDGTGTFNPLTPVAVGIDPNTVVARDVDADGHVDLAVANRGWGDISLARGRGDGTFMPTERVRGVPQAEDLAAADMNADGHLDLITVALFDGAVGILPGSAAGEFGPPILTEVDHQSNGIDVGDVDGDGRPDIAGAGMSPNHLGILLNRTPDTTGPLVRNLSIAPTKVTSSGTVQVTAIADEVGWSSSTTIASASFRIDGGAPKPLAAVDGRFDGRQESLAALVPASGLSAGAHTICVRAIDSLRNAGNATCGSLTVPALPADVTPPQTRLTSKNYAKIKDRTPTFRFRSSETGVMFSCRVDDRPWRPCTSPMTTSKLSKGKHTFRVRSIDRAGNIDPTPARDAFRVL